MLDDMSNIAPASLRIGAFRRISSTLPHRLSHRFSHMIPLIRPALAAISLIALMMTPISLTMAQNPVAPSPAVSVAPVRVPGVPSPGASQVAKLPPTVKLPLIGLGSPKPPAISAASAILVDAVSGQVIYEKNADQERPMASTTKIMTALLLCEYAAQNETVTASDYAVSIKESSIHLKKAEKLSVRDLLRAILMRSANDGCVAAAEHVAGTEGAFVEKMNLRAVELGALNTHFTNPHGLDNPEHYTTARDLSTIARAVVRNPLICEVVKCQKCKITRPSGSKDLTISNHSHFLGHYPGADGIKTGYTRPAGHCYVGSVTWGGWKLISVVLKSDHYVQDTAALMKYGFQNFAVHKISKAEEPMGDCPVSGGLETKTPVVTQFPVQFVTRKGMIPNAVKQLNLASVNAPIATGAVVGTMTVSVDGVPIVSSPLVSTASIDASPNLVKAVQGGNPVKTILMTTTFLGIGLVSLRYGKRYRSRIASFTKNTRSSWRRFASRMRNSHRQR